MSETTMTFTARSAYDPEKTATFTLQNGSVAINFGEKLRQQVEEAIASFDKNDSNVLQNVAKPAVSATMQKMMEPFPIQDFSAELDGEQLQAQAWVRAGGLRLMPIMFHWDHVDNPDGAAAFVRELEQRQAAASSINRFPGALDYWAIWVLAGITAVLVPILLWRQRPRS